uniref:Depolymerase 2 capsule K5-specific C-terminal domain-containing protein n=1 Tax=viral metagenome TaxID=1070528 RepID=A0A6H1ZBT3_9ZZZZ
MKWLILFLIALLSLPVYGKTLPQPLRNIQVTDSHSADARWNFDVIQGQLKAAVGFLPSPTQTLTVNSTIIVGSRAIPLAGDGAVTLTATPTIANGFDGQVAILIGTSNVNTVTIQHGTTYNLLLDQGQDFTLGNGDSIVLLFLTAIGDWIELDRKNVAG